MMGVGVKAARVVAETSTNMSRGNKYAAKYHLMPQFKS